MAALGVATAMAFAPDGDRLAVLAPSLAGRMTLTMIGPGQRKVWHQVLARNRMSSYGSEGVNLAWSPDGGLLACTTGTSTVWVIDAATGQPVRQFDGHSQTVTGLSWIGERPDPLGVHGRDAAGVAPGRLGALDRRGDHRGGGDGVRARAGYRADLVGQRRAAGLVPGGNTRPAVVPGIRRRGASPRTSPGWRSVPWMACWRWSTPGATELILISDWDRAASAPATTTTYANAKVLLLGDSGVGKSGLAMVLAGEEFRATESTHGAPDLAAPDVRGAGLLQATPGGPASGIWPASRATGSFISCTWKARPWPSSCSTPRARPRPWPGAVTGRGRSGTPIPQRSAG